MVIVASSSNHIPHLPDSIFARQGMADSTFLFNIAKMKDET